MKTAKEETISRKGNETAATAMPEKGKGAECKDKKCPFHGFVKTRGRTFKGHVVKLADKRAVIEFGRINYVYKYERYEKRKTRIHAHLPDCMASQIKVGDYVSVSECRPLSKIIHHVLTSKISGNAGK